MVLEYSAIGNDGGDEKGTGGPKMRELLLKIR